MPRSNYTRFFILAVAFVSWLGTARAAIILEVPIAVTGSVSHSYIPGDIFLDETGTVRDSLAVTTPTFTTDLSTLDGVTLAVSTAPGSRIEVIPPQGKSVSVLFSFSFATGGPVGAVLFPAAPTIFAGLIGPAPSMVFGQTQVRQNGNQFTLDAFYSVSAPFSFTGWSAAIEGPFGTSPGSRTYSASSAFVGFYYSDSVDGGQFSNVVPDGAAVPEPGVAVLLGVGLIGGGAIVRRRPASLRG